MGPRFKVVSGFIVQGIIQNTTAASRGWGQAPHPDEGKDLLTDNFVINVVS